MREVASTLVLPTARGSDLRSPAGVLSTSLFVFTFAGQAVRNLLDWQGFVAVAALLAAVALVVFWRHRRAALHAGAPVSLLAFLLLCALSLLWSDYEWATILGVGIQWVTAGAAILMARFDRWDTIQHALSHALRIILGSSLLFEVFVTVVLDAPLLPVYLDVESPPGAYYWSENLLLELGPIQGVVGNRNLLAFLALLSLVLTVVGSVERRRIDRRELCWIAVALLTMALTRSATVILALAAVAIVGLLVATIRRLPARRRGAAYLTALTLLSIGVTACWASAHSLLSVLGRTDASGRTAIWRTVADLAGQEPLIGWGWISYWAPWVPPFDGLIVIDGVEYLQAHNALLDIWLQLGVVGVAVAVVVAATVSVRTWRIASDGLPGVPRTAVPLLLLTALLFQSLTESRLLIEGNWMLFVVLCCVASTAARGRAHSEARHDALATKRPLTL